MALLLASLFMSLSPPLLMGGAFLFALFELFEQLIALWAYDRIRVGECQGGFCLRGSLAFSRFLPLREGLYGVVALQHFFLLGVSRTAVFLGGRLTIGHKSLPRSSCVLRFVYCSNRLPGGGVTFFAAAKKVTKESRLSDPKHLLERSRHRTFYLAQQ
ncbi:hypothetical protein [Candidatus Burkholderia verschuerenii]|uniref:hypothetical protein n=1 Tax=Candidatus Burkholderia verschuerenii TaxID=242163 RepID=UPI0012EDDFBE|nr:hypothetical protein [Candidatus Burkholderia verschuerenii]